MDTWNAELKRAARMGDPVAAASLKRNRARMNPPPSTFEPKQGLSGRTRRRWRAHLNDRCPDKCRFCRRGVSKGSASL